MKPLKHILRSWIFVPFYGIAFAQSPVGMDINDANPKNVSAIRVMFYNVENLFDTFDDPTTADDEFTIKGEKKWSEYRYIKKLNNIAKTIIAVGGWEPPAIIGLCEVENFQVLLDLTNKTMLQKYGYQIIHENSKDQRGIDNALLFRTEKLSLLSHKSIVIPLEGNATTRDILYASFVMKSQDTVHFFVNHWPSRIGGKDLTERKRMLAGHVLKEQTDSLFTLNSHTNLFIMGDFNDEPNDNSLIKGLGVKVNSDEKDHGYLYNLSIADFKSGKGTLVYKEIDNTWFLFDQMIVSSALIEGDGVSCPTKNSIFTDDWLLRKGKPYRTYQGPIYLGGFSDHLPIFIDLHFKE